MNGPVYKPAKYFTSRLGVSANSLRRWESNGSIQAIRSPGGTRLYSVESVERAFGTLQAKGEKKRIAYARVSSPKQKGDLERQIQELRRACPEHTIVSDVGSGLGFKRPGLRAILDQVHDGVVKEVAILHKDRLCRFASDLLAYIFEQAGVKLVVLRSEDEPDEFGDLAEDLLAVTTFFVARHNGRRSAQNKRRRREEERAARLGKRPKTDHSGEKGSRVSDQGATEHTRDVVRGLQAHVQPSGRALANEV